MQPRLKFLKAGLLVSTLFIILLALMIPSQQEKALASSPPTIISAAIEYQQSAAENEPDTSQDHSIFSVLQGPFETGPDVTAACLSCHSKAASQIMETSHWTWRYDHPITEEETGKFNIINNFCIGVASNEARCTSCHIGYGWTDVREPLEGETNVDCLVCHDTTATYKKFPTAAGHPAYEDQVFSGKEYPAADLALIAQNVGPTSVKTCGTCHFYGGGGEGVKHGSMDSSLLIASYQLDVHLSADGAGFTCTDCHQTYGHEIPGNRMEMTHSDNISCESCHTDQPHPYSLLNNHMDKIACQTCHIPEYARGGVPTKMYWDWSTAGDKNDEGAPFQVKDENGNVIYDSKKGNFEWKYNVVPEYIWFNGGFDFISIEDTFDPDQIVDINAPQGEFNDSVSKIYPMKEFVAISPYDAVTNNLVLPNLFPKPGEDAVNAYWKTWDWNLAIQFGMDYIDQPYSGMYGFVETVMYWPQTHMVAPKENALVCQDCHTPADSRLDFVALGYSPEVAERLENFPPNLVTSDLGAEENTPEACSECHIHEGQYELWLESSHSDKSVGCVACHTLQGEGEHPLVAFSREKSAEVCGVCHLDHHSDWELSRHAEVNIVCSDCHEPHRQGQRVLEGNETSCETCHRDVAAEVSHSTHSEMGYTCLACHKNTDAHGTYSNTGHSFQVYVGTCLSCHAETIHTASVLVEHYSEEPVIEAQTEDEPVGTIIDFPSLTGILLGFLLGIVAFLVIFGREPGIVNKKIK